MTTDNTAKIVVRLPPKEKEQWKENSKSMSGRIRRLIEAWNDAEDEHGIREDFEGINLAVLKTYRNAIEKNIQTLEAQKDKLQSEIDDIEEDEKKEVLFEVELDLEGHNL